MKSLFFLITIVCITLLHAHSVAEEYRWVDEKGVWHFSDNPPPDDLKTKPPLIEEVTPPAIAPEQKSLPEAKPRPKSTTKPISRVAPKVMAKPKKEPAVKVLPLKSEEPVKLYDLRGKVVQVAGVDTIILASGERVKYIGVRDPSLFLEKNGLSRKMKEAVNFHEKLVRGKTVTVLLGQRKRDKVGNYLGHVFLGQQAFVNAELLREGFAMTEEYPSDFEYQSLFIRLQRDAQEKGIGIWNY